MSVSNPFTEELPRCYVLDLSGAILSCTFLLNEWILNEIIFFFVPGTFNGRTHSKTPFLLFQWEVPGFFSMLLISLTL